MRDRQQEVVDGYMKGIGGLSETLPECYDKKSAAWKHGWRNGRDDRLGRPRECASVLRRRADMVLTVDATVTKAP